MGGVWCFLGSAGGGNGDFELLETLELHEGLIGSDAACALRLTDPMITSQHARLLLKYGDWYLGGVAIASPTLINGVPNVPGEARRLNPGDLVCMGDARFRFGGEPPLRPGLGPRDETARLIWADRLAEAGDPLGECVLEGRTPGDEVFPFTNGTFDAVWTHGVLTALSVRSIELPELALLLERPLADALERLTVHVATCAPDGEELEHARRVLQVLAATKPPRLHALSLGRRHDPAPLTGLERDWRALAKRLPLRTSADEAFPLSGTPRFTMGWSSPWWPPAHTTTQVPVVTFDTQTMYDARRINPAEPFGHQPSSEVWLGRAATGAAFIYGEDLVINGEADASGARLIHGDLVEGPHFALRFEED